jgi:hypothetical protein
MHGVPLCCAGAERHAAGVVRVHDAERRQQELGQGQQCYRDCEATRTIHEAIMLPLVERPAVETRPFQMAWIAG